FLHQAHARSRRSAHRSHPGRRCAIDHVDRRNLALCLQERPAHLRKQQSRVLRNLTRRCNRIPVVPTASRQDRAFHNRDISLTQLPHGPPPPTNPPPASPPQVFCKP